MENHTFAAANGASGFRNYFGYVFDTAQFKKIFIIKGGPGTGKSTFMRRAADAFSDTAAVEYVHCSSDQSSLDGVIIERGGKRVGLLDGTSPHARECELPGAVEELVDTGSFWNAEKLAAHRNEIESLNAAKSVAYGAGYRKLKLRGVLEDEMHIETERCFNKSAARLFMEELLKDTVPSSEFREDMRLYSSIGMLGEVVFDIPRASGRVMGLRGARHAAYLMLETATEILCETGLSFVRAPSPIADYFIEALMIPQADISIVYEKSCRNKVDSSFVPIEMSKFLDNDKYEKIAAQIAGYDEMCKIITHHAIACFGEAKRYHDALENIYVSSMDFEGLRDYNRAVTEQIGKLLK